MFVSLNRYFFRNIFLSKSKQYLLYLAVFGLFISAFALIVLQSSMGGLQHKLMERNKAVDGSAVVYLPDWAPSETQKVVDWLKTQKLFAVPEYELEMMVRHENFLAPVIVHGLSPKHALPSFIDPKKFTELILPYDLGVKLSVGVQDELRFISPSHVDQFFGDIPRQMTLSIDNLIITDVPEIDQYHVWVRDSALFNLMKKRQYNRIRLYTPFDYQVLSKNIQTKFGSELRLETWEARNSTLVWALSLENTVMVFLFVAMTLLVSLCITSGLLLFFGKVKSELASFWILGASEKKLQQAGHVFIHLLSFLSVISGLLLGIAFLWVFDRYGGDMMPDVFVDRKIPIYITPRGLLISFLVPYGVSLIFSYWSFRQFKKEVNYLEYVRTVG